MMSTDNAFKAELLLRSLVSSHSLCLMSTVYSGKLRQKHTNNLVIRHIFVIMHMISCCKHSYQPVFTVLQVMLPLEIDDELLKGKGSTIKTSLFNLSVHLVTPINDVCLHMHKVSTSTIPSFAFYCHSLLLYSIKFCSTIFLLYRTPTVMLQCF